MSGPRSRLEHEHLLADEMLADVRAAADRIAGLVHRMIDRAAIPVWDGYPAQASGAAGAGGGTQVTDPLAERIAARLSPNTDRDGEPLGDTDLTHARQREDPVGSAMAEAWRAMHEARRWMTLADRAIARANYVPADERPDERPEASGCVNCARWEIWSLAVRAGRCWACYQYRRRSPALEDRPEQLVRADQPGTKQRVRT